MIKKEMTTKLKLLFAHRHKVEDIFPNLFHIPKITVIYFEFKNRTET